MPDLFKIKLQSGRIESDKFGIEKIGKLFHDVKLLKSNDDIYIDCSKTTWIDAHFGAVLRLLSQKFSNGNRIVLKNLPRETESILRKNGTFKIQTKDTYNTTIPVSDFAIGNNNGFANFIRMNLQRKEMPKMNESLKRKFFESIDELFENSCLHADTELPIFCAGQYYPRGNKLTFMICDGGRGISGSLRAAKIPFKDDASAIHWAMQDNNTSRMGDIPGGLGLGILKEFLRLNRGRLIVASGHGYWEQCKNGKPSKALLNHPFPGSLAIMEVCTSDSNSYTLKTPIHPADVW